jgi:alkylation response protein AidB-like acyl-CoA dehydrogenase
MVTSPAALTAAELELREQVRAFLAETLPWGTFEPGLGMGAGVDRAFSAALAERGWIGMAVPVGYGGRDATAVDRFVVVEELLSWGAPVGHHWVADRQIAPVLLRYGTEDQKQWLLPRICRGELCFCIGMSEPDAGSDLASVRTRGMRDGDGWRVSGVKVWTSNAMRADFMIALCRTGEGERHAGLSRFLINMRSPGVTVKPIPYLNGSTDHFAEVVLDGVLVSDDMVIGEIGQGWAQNASELAFERSGPDRWISTFLLVQEFMREWPDLAASPAGSRLIGELAAQYWVLRRLSVTVARAIDAGDTPSAEAALIKEMGTRFE